MVKVSVDSALLHMDERKAPESIPVMLRYKTEEGAQECYRFFKFHEWDDGPNLGIVLSGTFKLTPSFCE